MAELTVTTRSTSVRRFLRHLIEMAFAMIGGMMVLGPVAEWLFDRAGASATYQRPDIGALVMAATMTIGMTVWMVIRRHRGVVVAEMAAAMAVPFLLLCVPYWFGVLSGGALMTGGHVLMVLAMIGVMLRRPDVYAARH